MRRAPKETHMSIWRARIQVVHQTWCWPTRFTKERACERLRKRNYSTASQDSWKRTITSEARDWCGTSSHRRHLCELRFGIQLVLWGAKETDALKWTSQKGTTNREHGVHENVARVERWKRRCWRFWRKNPDRNNEKKKGTRSPW